MPEDLKEHVRTESVFGEKNSPHTVFDRARAEAAHAPSFATAQQDLGLGCPTCRLTSKEPVRMLTRPGSGYFCPNGHKWMDVDELMALNPEKLPFLAKKARQEGYRELRCEMPGSTLDALQKKFPTNLAETVSAILDVISQQRFMLINEESLERLEQLFGQTLKNGQHVVGLIWAAKEKDREQNEELERLRARQGSATPSKPTSATSVNVELGDMCAEITKLAYERGQPVEELLAGTFRQWKESNWV